MDTAGIYKKLQKHLNRQPVGFPATRSGVEIEILRHVFSPEEAEIATFMSYKPETADVIHSRMGSNAIAFEELSRHLEAMFRKGGVFSKTKNGKRVYALAPFVMGIYEMQHDRLTPDFIEKFNIYTNDKNFGVEFLSTERPQIRTIPISESIMPSHKVNTYDQVESIVNTSREPFVIVECICRKKKTLEGGSCKMTRRKETCLAMGDAGNIALDLGFGRRITRDEALAHIAQSQKEGLVLQPSNTKDAEFLCSCCGCCCGMLEMHHLVPNPNRYWATNFHVTVDQALCNGCGVCEKRCQVNAIRVNPKTSSAKVDPRMCLGCGVCVPTCPQKALALAENAQKIEPPQTIEALFDEIMEKKKSRIGKIGVALKLAYDAIRTGRLDTLKPR